MTSLSKSVCSEPFLILYPTIAHKLRLLFCPFFYVGTLRMDVEKLFQPSFIQRGCVKCYTLQTMVLT